MPDEVSWIAKERLEPGQPSNQWITSVIILAGVVFLVLAVMGLSPLDRVDAEETFRTGDGPVQALDASLAPSLARTLRAAAAATAVLATAFAARRILHHEAASTLAAGLLLLDPGFLVHGRLATPVAPAVAAGMLALALFMSARPYMQWVASVMLAVAAFMDPAYLAWGLVLGLMLLVRGHIYAAPQHAAAAGIQALVIPGVGALLGIFAGDSLGPDCYVAPRGLALFGMAPVSLGGDIYWHPNPVLWFAGIGAIAWLGVTAAIAVLGDFRLQRLPGRIQVRLSQPLRRIQGRSLWVLALLALAPSAAMWMPLLAIALAAAILEVGRDSPRFTWLVGGGIVIVALAYTVRLWPLLIGGDDLSALATSLPWAQIRSCG